MSRIHSRIRGFAYACVLLLLPLSTQTAAQASGSPTIRLDRVLSLGGDFGREGATFVDVSDVAAGPNGDIYVLDTGEKAVKVYSASGLFIRRFGRRGGGPGEFQLPTSLRVDSVVRVSDLGQQRMSYFSLVGRHLQTLRTPEVGDAPLLNLTPLRDGWIIGSTPARMGLTAGGRERSGSPYVEIVAVSSTGRQDTLLRPHSGVSAFHPRRALAPFGTLESHAGRGGTHAVLGDSVVAIADGYSGEVRWYRMDRGGLEPVRTRQLPSRSRPLAPDDVRRIERQLYTEFPDLQRGFVIEPPPRVSIATQALFAADGSLWIRNTAGKGHAHVWTVFDPRGEIAFRLSLPAGFDLRHVRGDRLYGTARTENDAPVVHVYRLVRG